MLAMKDLAGLCERLGYRGVRTFINSGNVLFRAAGSEKDVCAALEKALLKHMKADVAVYVRTAPELDAVLRDNPFADADPGKVIVYFMNASVPKSVLDTVVAPGGEQVALGKRELYIYYPEGMGRSKLKIRLTDDKGTARNINSVRKLLALAAQA
jgi:uncharacterized protein (DUF1697 family)